MELLNDIWIKLENCCELQESSREELNSSLESPFRWGQQCRWRKRPCKETGRVYWNGKNFFSLEVQEVSHCILRLSFRSIHRTSFSGEVMKVEIRFLLRTVTPRRLRHRPRELFGEDTCSRDDSSRAPIFTFLDGDSWMKFELRMKLEINALLWGWLRAPSANPNRRDEART